MGASEAMAQGIHLSLYSKTSIEKQLRLVNWGGGGIYQRNLIGFGPGHPHVPLCYCPGQTHSLS